MSGLLDRLKPKPDPLKHSIEVLAEGIDHARKEQRAATRTLLERFEAVMANIQNLADAIDAQGQTIQQEAQEVKAKLDEQSAIIADLRNQANPDTQPLIDRLEQNNQGIRAIFTGEPVPEPSPSPEPAPQPAPERRR